MRNGWQPIETAPKDGTAVIGFSMAEYHHNLSHWKVANAAHFARWVCAFHERDDENHYPPEGWYSIPGGYHKYPSHWMKLEEPPVP